MRFAASGFLIALSSVAFAGFQPSSSPDGPNGLRATVDLPTSQHMRNVGGSDGAGLCVFTSIQHSARWQNLIGLEGYREWMRRRPGGGYPQKVDSTLKAFCREKGVPVPEYVQHTGGDDSFLDLAMKTGRCPCVTYAGRDDFYSGGIDHMINLVYLDQSSAAVLDNNRPGTWLWMSRTEFLQRWRARGGGWAVVFLSPPPPPHTTTPISADESPPSGQTVFGQCLPGGACPAPSAGRPIPHPFANPFVVPAPKAPEWKKEGIYYRLGNEGVYHPESGLWCPYHGNGAWGPWQAPPKGLALPQVAPKAPACNCDCCKKPCGCEPGKRDPNCLCYPCPADPPKQAVPAPAMDEPLTGVVSDKIHDSPLYSLSGNPVSKEEAHAALQGGGLVDDSDRWHVTVVGDQSFRARVKADLAKLPSDVRTKFHVQEYPTDHWAVATFALKEGVTLRKQAGMSRMAEEAAAIAKADYTPEALNKMCPFSPPPPPPAPPGPPNNPPPPPPDAKNNVGWWLVLALGSILAIFRRK